MCRKIFKVKSIFKKMCYEEGQQTFYKIGNVELQRVFLEWFKEEEKAELYCSICDREIISKTFYDSPDSGKHFCNKCFLILKPKLKKIISKSE